MKTVTLAVSSLIAAAVAPLAASAQFFRPDSASATSVFSSGYVVANAINGTGLPAGFGPLSSHANYASGNHWTTANGRTIGESATFSFTTPKTVGGFYMWAHRSNGVASNPNYAVTRFDLVFRDAAGATLANLTDLVGLPNIPIAQTYTFNQVSNVSSIQFIVRATLNNNVSPYTGLAEVAFDSCIAATCDAPSNVTICPDGIAEFNAVASGTGPFAYAWRHNSNPINPLANPSASTATLNVAAVAGNIGSYDCVITTPCGSITSAAATLSICVADFNCDGSADFFDYLDFVDAFAENSPAADFNLDSVIDFFDYLDYVDAFSVGC